MIKFTWYNYISRVFRGISITPYEAEILFLLFVHRGTVLSDDDFIEFMWPNPNHEPLDPNSMLKVYIYRIRRKFGTKLIMNAHSRGYYIER